MEIEKENPTISSPPTDDNDKFFSNDGGRDDDADSISLSSSSDQEDDDIDIEHGDKVGDRQIEKKLSRQSSLNHSILAPLPFGSMFADLESPFENDDDDIEGGISDLDTSQKSVSTKGSRRSSLPKFLEKYSPSGEDIDGSQHSRGSSTRSGRRHSMKKIGSSSSLRNLQRRMSSFPPKIKKRRVKFHYRSRQKAQLDEVDANESMRNETKKVRLNAWINYEVFMWTWFIVLTVLAVVDRFGWNVWPRQVSVVRQFVCIRYGLAFLSLKY